MNEQERLQLLDGLQQLRERGPSGLYAPDGPSKHLLQCFVPQQDAAMLRLSGTMCDLLTGRRESQTTVIRRALAVYAGHLAAALRSPEMAVHERTALAAVRTRQRPSGSEAKAS